MSQQVNSDTQRIFFLDNLRFVLVLLVLIFHAGASYSSAVDFWPYHESNYSESIDLFMLLCDVFLMSTLYFIAGYFALPSLKKRGVGGYIKSKFKVLGVPWLLIIVFLLPVLDYIHYLSQIPNGMMAESFSVYWRLAMEQILGFHVGWMDMSAYTNMTEHFYQRYMWFLSLLLLFHGIFALLYVIKKKVGSTEQTPKKIYKSKGFVFSIVALLSTLLFAAVKLFVYSEVLGMGWFSLGNIFQFQLAKMTVYAVYFGFGIYAFSNNWFVDGKNIGKPWLWGLASFSAFGMNMLVFKYLSEVASPSLSLKMAHSILYPLWMLAFLGLSLSIAYKYWNRTTSWSKKLTTNSYNMYLVHYIFPMTLPLLLSNWLTGTVIVKFTIVAVVTVGLSYILSRFLIKPYPKLSGVLVAGLAVLLMIIT